MSRSQDLPESPVPDAQSGVPTILLVAGILAVGGVLVVVCTTGVVGVVSYGTARRMEAEAGA